MANKLKHIVIDARIRRASTGRPVDRLLEHLQELDSPYRFTVLVEPYDPWKPTNRRFTAVPCKFKQFSWSPLQQIRFSWQLYRLKPNLVHFTLTGQQPLFYYGKQITFTHDLTMLKYARAGRLPKWLHRIRMRLYRLNLWQSHHLAKRILVPTEYVKDAVQKYHLFTGRKVVVTLEASEPPLPGKAVRPEILKDELSSVEDDRPFILYVGSAFPHKNLRRLVKSFELIRENHPEFKLVITGKQEYHARRLQRWANKKPYSQHIIFTGFVSDEELKWLYENAAVYAFPSLSEGFGLPGLEAMVHGCPVASSNATCLPEVYGDAAHYFDPEEIEDMAEKIVEVIDNEKLRDKMIEKGYQQVKKFSWKKMAEETIDIYSEVL